VIGEDWLTNSGITDAEQLEVISAPSAIWF
jgi:hypothetical protein